MPLPVGRLAQRAYLLQHWSILYPLMAVNRVVGLVATRWREGGPPQEAREDVRRRFRKLLEQDVENVREGLYPRALLFQIPFGTYARALPKVLRDMPAVLRRMRARDHRDLPADIDLTRYPAYYRRNFHWQTDGYLSRHSAEVYDLTVELLFLGTADVMRRQVIPPVSRFLTEELPSNPSLLDLGCGTGRTLRQIAAAHPGLRLLGLDLSPFYLQVARKVLAKTPGVSLLAENAEQLPFVDNHFDIVTSAYLFHELPHEVRRRVIAEAYRVLRPNGLLVIEDSIQVADSEELAFFMGKFASDYHEPYYQDYIQDDLTAPVHDAGFDVRSVEAHYVSRVLVARK